MTWLKSWRILLGSERFVMQLGWRILQWCSCRLAGQDGCVTQKACLDFDHAQGQLAWQQGALPPWPLIEMQPSDSTVAALETSLPTNSSLFLSSSECLWQIPLEPP